MSDLESGGMLDLFALVVAKVSGGEDLVGLRQPGGVLWEGSVPLAADWIARVRARKGQLVSAYAVPDSSAVQAPVALSERVCEAADNDQLLGGRIPVKEATWATI
ncbi:hypothetical protein [Actinorhabdospora filicis]|nr:hypothetical protein [Actinorhabdospora filicis]